MADDFHISRQQAELITSAAIQLVVNQSSINVNTIELTTEIIIGNVNVITNKIEKIENLERELDLYTPRNQLVIYEELNHLGRLIQKSSEIDTLVGDGRNDLAKNVAAFTTSMSKMKQTLKSESNSFAHNLGTRAMVKYGRHHTNLGQKILDIKMEAKAIARDLVWLQKRLETIKKECQKPNGIIRWITNTNTRKLRNVSVWVGRTTKGELKMEAGLDGRLYEKRFVNEEWNQVVEKDQKTKYVGGIAIMNNNC